MNSVVDLRLEALAHSTRPFLARGSKCVRCERCLLRQEYCICSQRPKVQGRSAVLMLMYHGEMLKPSNTGRLIADVVADNHAFEWTRTDFDPQLLALINHSDYAPMLVFPHEYAEAERCIRSPLQLPAIAEQQKTPLFILLDGTWREAKKMFKSPYLAHLPVLGIQPTQCSRYHLREAYHEHQLCTVEVMIEVLKLAEDNAYAQALNDYFEVFKHHYLSSKANVAV